MKKFLIMAVALACAIGAQADGDWKTTLGKVKDFSGDMGFMAFMKREAPAYITGNFAEAERPEKKPMSANRNGYYDKDLKWHGGYFDDAGAFVKGHEVKTLFGMPYGIGQLIMIPICIILMYLAIVKGFEPLLLLPIGFGGLLANCPLAGVTMPATMHDGVISFLSSGLPVMSRHRHGRVPDHDLHGRGRDDGLRSADRQPEGGASRRRGAVRHLLRALRCARLCVDLRHGLLRSRRGSAQGGGVHRHHRWCGRPDGHLSYMALVPIIQPPIMKALTTKSERLIKMPQLREVKKIEKICFPLVVLLLCALLLPSAVPLIGALMLGNLAKEVGPSVGRIADTMSNALINIVTIMLGLSVGSKLACEKFLSGTTLAILALGLCAFCVGTGAGVIMAKIMNLFSKTKVNPLIGSAGVSAVPMAARVSNKVALSEDPTNFLLMQAMGPNVSGVIGSAVVAGVLYTLCR